MSERPGEPRDGVAAQSQPPNRPARVQQGVHRIVVPPEVPMVALLGAGDLVLRGIERALPSADIHVRGNEVTVTGPLGEVALVERLIDELIAVLESGQQLTPDAVERTVGMLRQQTTERPADVLTLNILSNRGRTIRPKTLNQKRYVDAIDEHTIVFGIGPAGTGKTYLAMAKAVQSLQAKRANRIILTRPAVEAGERLGFLPGTVNEKIDPYLRPLYDALHDMIDPESIPRLMAAGTIEVAPLAYMRGRAQPVEAPVLTPEGFRPIGSLRVGDFVIGSDGRPTPVLGVYPQGRKEVYRVRTQDGASALACAEHLWFVTAREDRRHAWAGRVIRTRDMIGNLGTAHHRNFALPLVAPVHFEPREVPIEPYALGRLLPGRHEQYDYLPRPPADGRGGLLVADPVPVAPARLGLAGTGSTSTSVPAEYLLNCAEVRLAVLQGLLDTGGGAVRQAGRTCQVQFSTCSQRLRDDVVFLVRSLGGVADRPVSRGHDAYILDIRLPDGVEPFRLARKQRLYDAGDGAPRRRPVRFVAGIESAGKAECVCISVAAQDSLYVTADFLLTHNTLNDAFIILDEAQNTSAEQMKMFLTRLGFGSQMVVTGDVTQVDLPTGTQSGLRIVREILDGVEDVHFALLTSRDVVRHRLVSDIVDAYSRWDATRRQRR